MKNNNEIIKICYSCVDLMDHRPLFASPNDCQDFDVCCDETREILEETLTTVVQQKNILSLDNSVTTKVLKLGSYLWSSFGESSSTTNEENLVLNSLKEKINSKYSQLSKFWLEKPKLDLTEIETDVLIENSSIQNIKLIRREFFLKKIKPKINYF